MKDDRNGMSVDDGLVVFLDFALRLEDGELISDSDEDGQMAFIQGRGHVFPDIEQAVQGLHVGDEAELVIEPDDAYGLYDEDLLEEFPLEEFPSDFEVTVGLVVELTDEESGEEVDGVVVEVDEDSVVVDLNHPLAGEALFVWCRVTEIREPTEEELAHDHVHVHEHEHGHGHDHDHDHDNDHNGNHA